MQKFYANALVALLILFASLERAGAIQFRTGTSWAIMTIVALMIVWTCWKLHSTHQYQEYLYQPLDAQGLPRKTRDHFDKHTWVFREMGFESVEDTRLQVEPFQHDVRLLLNRAGDIWGEINVIGDPSLFTVACTSVFDDGMLIETVSISAGNLPQPKDRMQWHPMPGAGVEEIYHRHRESVESYRAATGAEPMAFGPEDYQAVITYGHRLLWHWRQRQQLTKQPVPEAVLPRPSRSAVLS